MDCRHCVELRTDFRNGRQCRVKIGVVVPVGEVEETGQPLPYTTVRDIALTGVDTRAQRRLEPLCRRPCCSDRLQEFGRELDQPRVDPRFDRLGT